MNRLALISVLAFALSPMAASAQQAQPASLPAWDQLTEAQRAELTAPIRERWNNAASSDRAEMMERAKRWKAMPAEQRQRASRGMKRFESMHPAAREKARALFHAMRGMDEAQRSAFLDKWHAMTPEQRRAWLDAHPAPERRRRDESREPGGN